MEANEPNAIRIYYVAREHLKERPAGLTNPVRVHTLFHLSGHVEPSAEDAAALRAYLLNASSAEESADDNTKQAGQ